jgi:NADH-quinone oxidoreductase subunit J
MDTSFFEQILYFIVILFMLGGAIWTVSSPNILHAALGLITTFSATAILYTLLHAEFVSLAQVMVYIGGVLIFTVFTILLTTRLGDKHFPTPWLRVITSAILAGGVFSIFARVLLNLEDELNVRQPICEDYASLLAIGSRLLSPERGGYLVPFEVVSLLLLSTMIGAVVITRRPGETEEGAIKKS